MKDGDEIAAKLKQVREKLQELQRLENELEYQLSCVGIKDYPTEPGWYEDANLNIARLRIIDNEPVWDDGWGNYGLEYGLGLPALPLTRLVPLTE